MRKVSPEKGKDLDQDQIVLGAVPGPYLRYPDYELLPFSVFFGYLLYKKHSSGHWEFRSKQGRCLFSHGICILVLGAGKQINKK